MRKITYDEYFEHCRYMADKIKTVNPTCLIPVMRGGMTASHIISKMLNLQVGAFFPGTEQLVTPPPVANPTWIFIEDLVAKGRTFQIVKTKMKDVNYINPSINWYFCPFLIDDSVDVNIFEGKLLTYGLKTKEWLVMPYEEKEKMIEGDRGLFRDGSDKYGKQ